MAPPTPPTYRAGIRLWRRSTPNFHSPRSGRGSRRVDLNEPGPAYASDANWSWLFQQQMPGASTLPTPTPTPTPTGKEITPTSGGILTDASGNKWTLTSAGVVDENGTPVPGGSGTVGLRDRRATCIYGQDATTQDWFTYSPASQSWTSSAAPVLTPTPTPPTHAYPTHTYAPPNTYANADRVAQRHRRARRLDSRDHRCRRQPLDDIVHQRRPGERDRRPHPAPTSPRSPTSIRRCGRRTRVINGTAGPGQDGAPAMIPCRTRRQPLPLHLPPPTPAPSPNDTFVPPALLPDHRCL